MSIYFALSQQPKTFFILFRGHPDPEQWPSTTITPKNGLFTLDENEETKFMLAQLLPNQQYFLKVEMHVRDSDVEKVTNIHDSDWIALS